MCLGSRLLCVTANLANSCFIKVTHHLHCIIVFEKDLISHTRMHTHFTLSCADRFNADMEVKEKQNASVFYHPAQDD